MVSAKMTCKTVSRKYNLKRIFSSSSQKYWQLIKENKGGCIIIIHHKVRTKTTDSHPHFHGVVFADYFWGLLTGQLVK
jgi:hypothetical protein